MINLETFSALTEIAAERSKQIDSGRDSDHDDNQSLGQWAWLIARRANDLGSPNLALISEDEPRRLLVEISAISVAAIEALDRQAKAPAHLTPDTDGDPL
jgi:hypothetical protein